MRHWHSEALLNSSCGWGFVNNSGKADAALQGLTHMMELMPASCWNDAMHTVTTVIGRNWRFTRLAQDCSAGGGLARWQHAVMLTHQMISLACCAVFL